MRMWIESASASVRITTGALPEKGDRVMPAQPATPRAVTVASEITASVATVPATERRISQITTTSPRNIAGNSVTASAIVASAKALLRAETPVSATSISGWARSTRAARSLAAAVACVTSDRSSPGYWRVTLMPVVVMSGEIRRSRSSGSATAVATRAATCRSVRPAALPTRSSTISSSPTARECWWLVSESTRVANGICQASRVMSSMTAMVAEVATLPLFGLIANRKLSFFV